MCGSSWWFIFTKINSFICVFQRLCKLFDFLFTLSDCIRRDCCFFTINFSLINGKAVLLYHSRPQKFLHPAGTTVRKTAFHFAKIHIFHTLLAHLASYHYCIFLEGVKVTQKWKLYIDKIKKLIKAIKCKFSMHYLVYKNYKLISEAAIGRGSRKLILKILKLL